MTQNQLISLSRLEIPEISQTSVISDADLLSILNLACREFVKGSDALPKNDTFDLVLNQLEYSISTVLPDFGKPHKNGLWFYNAQAKNWRQLEATTISYLGYTYPTYLNTAASNPYRYSIEGDTLTIHPPASATYAGADYLKLYYFGRSIDMAGANTYPFSGSATLNYSHLQDFEDSLIYFVKYKIKKMLGKDGDAEEAKQMFYSQVAGAKTLFTHRPDLVSSFTRVNSPVVSQSLGMFKG